MCYGRRIGLWRRCFRYGGWHRPGPCLPPAHPDRGSEIINVLTVNSVGGSRTATLTMGWKLALEPRRPGADSPPRLKTATTARCAATTPSNEGQREIADGFGQFGVVVRSPFRQNRLMSLKGHIWQERSRVAYREPEPDRSK